MRAVKYLVVLLSIVSVNFGGVVGVGTARGSDLYTLSNNDLYRLNQTTGVATFIGPTGVNLADLASDTRAASFRLFGIGNTGGATLYNINPLTGQTTGTLLSNGPSQMISLAFDVTTNQLYGTGGANSGFYKIDPASGLATFLGNVNDTVTGMTATTTGRLYALTAFGNILELNKTNGAVLTSAFDNTSALTDLAARPEDNVMFTLRAIPTPTLYTINEFGTVTTVATITGAATPLEIASGPVPEPTSLALFAIAGAALLKRER